MRAARLEAIRTLALREVAKPRPGPGELLVRVEAVGICGSDRHMFKGEYPTALPVTLGHEFCGIVAEVGEGVSRFRGGERVTGDPNIACGWCARCREGRPNLCDKLTAIGVFRDGGFADCVIVPEGQAYGLPGDLDPLHGAFCEPLACCLHGLDVARIQPGDSVAVLGGGVIGLLMVQLAARAGARRIAMVTRQPVRRAVAISLGATEAIDPADEPVAALRDAVGGGADVVLECAGVPETFVQGLRMARRGGAFVLFGVMPAGVAVPVVPFDLLVNELRIESAWLNPFTHQRAADMVAAGTLELDRLISRTIGLDDVPGVVGAPAAAGDIKVIAVP
ncbi:zinc-dependent alcohol dehydrogenase family protein [uncultured Devosia sp.]|uniref:zinc-dependent alcohol dehydrogenase family protein n=1 Tax=uncultured Devosia sp. TaxID=211434 RepID=UPI0035CAF7ED